MLYDHNGYAQRLMQSISYTKQYALDTGEMSYREIRQSIVRLCVQQSKTDISITAVIVKTVGTGRSLIFKLSYSFLNEYHPAMGSAP